MGGAALTKGSLLVPIAAMAFAVVMGGAVLAQDPPATCEGVKWGADCLQRHESNTIVALSFCVVVFALGLWGVFPRDASEP